MIHLVQRPLDESGIPAEIEEIRVQINGRKTVRLKTPPHGVLYRFTDDDIRVMRAWDAVNSKEIFRVDIGVEE